MVRYIDLTEMQKHKYFISPVSSTKQYWRDSNVFSCLNTPKKVNMLLYIDGLDAEYILPDGSTMIAYGGSVVYLPIGSQYKTTFVNNQNNHGYTIGVNFYVYDENGEHISFDKDIKIFNVSNKSYTFLFEKVNLYGERPVMNYARMNAALYDIISNLCEQFTSQVYDKYSIISDGIIHLEENVNSNISISEIAGMCNVSEAYFRRLFKEYSGMSPNQYRMHHKIERAKLLMKYDGLSVAEAADRLSFSTASYFSMVFKRETGMSPMEYIKINKL